MSWALQSTGAVAVGSVNGGITIADTGSATGNIDLMHLGARASSGVTGTWPDVSGWTKILLNDADSGSLGGQVYGRAAAGVQSSVVVTGTGAVSAMGYMTRWSGGSLTLHASALGYEGSLVEDIATEGLTISIPNTLVLILASRSFNLDPTVTSWPSGFTGIVAAKGTTGSFGDDMSIFGGYSIQTTAANISSSSIDLTATDALRNSRMILSLAPAAVNTPIAVLAGAM